LLIRLRGRPAPVLGPPIILTGPILSASS
jgi:hypothetical protein